MDQHRPVSEAKRGQLGVTRRLAYFSARTSAQERQRIAMAADVLLILDARRAERLLNASAGMHPRPSIIAIADKQNWLVAGGSFRF